MVEIWPGCVLDRFNSDTVSDALLHKRMPHSLAVFWCQTYCVFLAENTSFHEPVWVKRLITDDIILPFRNYPVRWLCGWDMHMCVCIWWLYVDGSMVRNAVLSRGSRWLMGSDLECLGIKAPPSSLLRTQSVLSAFSSCCFTWFHISLAAGPSAKQWQLWTLP